MPFVLDASITMSWCFEDETSPASEALLDRLATDSAFVPAIWQYEVANVLIVGERRGRITESQAARFISLLGRLPIKVEATMVYGAVLLAAAHRHDLSAYDAAYLVLAERHGVGLATDDQQLRSAAKAAGVPLIN